MLMAPVPWPGTGDLAAALSPPTGALLPPTETQQLLFGSDDKCFTRMTPVLLLLAKSWRGHDALASSSYLSADGVVDVAPYPQLRSVPFITATEKHGVGGGGGRGKAPVSHPWGSRLGKCGAHLGGAEVLWPSPSPPRVQGAPVTLSVLS